MDTERVVEVWVPDTQEVGSGYLLTNSLVLTAYHVVKGIRKHARIEVRPLSKGAGRPWLTASMCWPSRFVDLDAHPEQDAALLVISPSDRPTEPLPGTVRFGQVVGQKPIPCIGLGFPEAEERPDNVRDTLPVRGKVDPLHGYKAKLLTVHIDEGVVPLGWSGASGEALFCGPLLVGVLATDHRIAADNSVLLAVPVSALASLPGFRDALTTHGIELHIEPAPVSKTERLLKPYFAAVSRAVREQPYPGLQRGSRTATW
ncbi:hypothetical protein [Kitasatospora sp. NPDC047058]|uniref:hypothetical protein n=1 Tax=Kitasatospora sp. NPDC047058 TaxID=3155620 RepID=UPI0033C1662B